MTLVIGSVIALDVSVRSTMRFPVKQPLIQSASGEKTLAQQDEFNGDLRATHFTREIQQAKRSIPMGNVGVFMRVTLGLIFMYLVVISYSMLGVVGPMVVSVLFLVALLAPVVYHARKTIMVRRRARAKRASGIEETEVRQEG